MTVGPVGAAMPTFSPVGTAGLTTSPTATDPAAGKGGFSSAVDLIDGLQNQQNNADSLALQAAMGNGNVGDVMIAATQASLSTNMTIAVRNKAVEAFNQIMGMQF